MTPPTRQLVSEQAPRHDLSLEDVDHHEDATGTTARQSVLVQEMVGRVAEVLAARPAGSQVLHNRQRRHSALDMLTLEARHERSTAA
jgi:hypothetical protein